MKSFSKKAFHIVQMAVVAAFLTLFTGARLDAGPAHFNEITMTQPDGRTFIANFYGDEFYRIVTTKDGCAIIKDDNGWWCYAYYDQEGCKYSSEVHVGAPASIDVLDAARRIPYSTLADKALEKRSFGLPKDEEPVLRRVYKAQKGHDPSLATKADTPTQKHGIILLVQFSDIKFKNDKAKFEELITTKSTSAINYFKSQFNDQVQFHFDISDIITLDNPVSYYGANNNDGDDKLPGQMIYDACVKADDIVDFSLYDDDGDMFVDNLFVFYAGEDESQTKNTDLIWAHAWNLTSTKYFGHGGNPDNPSGYFISNDNNVKVNQYACASELATTYTTTSSTTRLTGIGTFCHEFSHTLGLKDLYDVDYEQSGGVSAAMWRSTALMDGGNANNRGDTPPSYNCIEREWAAKVWPGISQPEEIHMGQYTLEPVERNGRYIKIPTDSEDEYFLIECRGSDNWNQYIGYTYKAASGLLVYHIDKSDKDAWGKDNKININPDHQNADLIEADKRIDKRVSRNDNSEMFQDIRGIFFPYGSTMLTSESNPAYKTWSGKNVDYPLLNIKKNSNGTVSFLVGGDVDEDAIPEAQNAVVKALPDAAIMQWSTATESIKLAYLSYSIKGEASPVTASVMPYEPGKYMITFKELRPGQEYEAEIWYQALDGTKGEVTKVPFTTLTRATDKYPYIYIEPEGYLVGGNMVLHAVNSSNADEMSWIFDGKLVSASADGYYHPASAGEKELRATIKTGDKIDIITRKITVYEQ